MRGRGIRWKRVATMGLLLFSGVVAGVVAEKYLLDSRASRMDRRVAYEVCMQSGDVPVVALDAARRRVQALPHASSAQRRLQVRSDYLHAFVEGITGEEELVWTPDRPKRSADHMAGRIAGKRYRLEHGDEVGKVLLSLGYAPYEKQGEWREHGELGASLDGAPICLDPGFDQARFDPDSCREVRIQGYLSPKLHTGFMGLGFERCITAYEIGCADGK